MFLKKAEAIRTWINTWWVKYEPDSFGLKVASWVTTLDLSNKELTSLPPEIGVFSALRDLNLANNALTTLPKELRHLPLKTLNLDGNNLTTVPNELIHAWSTAIRQHPVIRRIKLERPRFGSNPQLPANTLVAIAQFEQAPHLLALISKQWQVMVSQRLYPILLQKYAQHPFLKMHVEKVKAAHPKSSALVHVRAVYMRVVAAVDAEGGFKVSWCSSISTRGFTSRSNHYGQSCYLVCKYKSQKLDELFYTLHYTQTERRAASRRSTHRN